MKRKIYARLAAVCLAATLIVPASAAEAARRCPQRPFWCPPGYWQQICPNLPAEPECPTEPERPVEPELPTEPEKPVEPDAPVLPEKPNASMTALEKAACDRINQERAAYGLAPLSIDENLSVKARIKSQDMQDNRYFAHNSPTYGTPFAMMKALGISYRTAGENIAMGYQTADAVVAAWMASEGHRNNILNANYTSMGIGYVNGYWTQWFIG